MAEDLHDPPSSENPSSIVGEWRIVEENAGEMDEHHLSLLVHVVAILALHPLVSTPLNGSFMVPLSAPTLHLTSKLLQRCLTFQQAAAWSPEEAFVWLIPGRGTRSRGN